MPIQKDGNGAIQYTKPEKEREFEETGTIRDTDFAIADKINVLKQIQFDINPLSGDEGVLTLQADIDGDQTIIITDLASGSFSTIQPDSGTSPTAATGSDTLTLTSPDGSVRIAGDSGTDTISISAANPRYQIKSVEDWIATASQGATGWTAYASGTSATTVINTALATGNVQGVVETRTGTDTTGRLAMFHGNPVLPPLRLGGGVCAVEFAIRIEDLSTASDEYDIRVGLGDTTSADQANGCYFEYNREVSTNWAIKTASGSTRTTTDTGVVVAADAWIRLRVVVNAAATSVEYFINGTSAGTITTNIPTSSNVTEFSQILKSAGGNSRNLYLDWCELTYTLTTPRV